MTNKKFYFTKILIAIIKLKKIIKIHTIYLNK